MGIYEYVREYSGLEREFACPWLVNFASTLVDFHGQVQILEKNVINVLIYHWF